MDGVNHPQNKLIRERRGNNIKEDQAVNRSRYKRL